jgi:hypothetical protein
MGIAGLEGRNEGKGSEEEKKEGRKEGVRSPEGYD